MSTIGRELFEAVVSAAHPMPEQGGPCATCAFRPGTEPNLTPHTALLATLCIDAIEPFHCHEQTRLCRGWIAAVNMREFIGGLPHDEESRRQQEAAAFAADVLRDAIAAGVAADRAAGRTQPSNG